jgi:hypothetical protein
VLLHGVNTVNDGYIDVKFVKCKDVVIYLPRRVLGRYSLSAHRFRIGICCEWERFKELVEATIPSDLRHLAPRRCTFFASG